jgi:hypothetical protein
MTVSDTIQGTAEIRAERDRLAAEGKQILERSAGTLSDEDAQRFGEIEADLEDLRKRHDQWAMVERALANGWTESGDGARRDNLETAQHLRRTDPWADLDRPLESEPGQIRSRALTAVERLERMPDKAREAATRAIEDDDDHTSRLARYTLLASDPQHYKAFSQWFQRSAERPAQLDPRGTGRGPPGQVV